MPCVSVSMPDTAQETGGSMQARRSWAAKCARITKANNLARSVPPQTHRGRPERRLNTIQGVLHELTRRTTQERGGPIPWGGRIRHLQIEAASARHWRMNRSSSTPYRRVGKVPLVRVHIQRALGLALPRIRDVIWRPGSIQFNRSLNLELFQKRSQSGPFRC